MKRVILLIILNLPLSCYNGLSDMYDELGMKVPICVNSSVAVSGDGRGWGNAFKTIQEAVDAATTSDGDVIWVAGSFNPLGGQTVLINKKIIILGGFTGTESRREDLVSSSKTSVTGTADPVFDITASGVVIDNFNFNNKTSGLSIRQNGQLYSAEIQNCVFDTNGASGIYIGEGTVNIKDCFFINNPISAVSIDGGNVTIKNSFFNSNGGAQGSAIILIEDTLSNKTIFLDIDNTLFQSNNVTGSGGALYIWSNPGDNITVTIKNSNFKNNSANQYGGACYFENTDSLTIDNCSFGSSGTSSAADKNTARSYGGAIYLKSTFANFVNSKFYSNEAGMSGTEGFGGAIFSGSASSLTLSSSIISGNRANNSNAWGGGIYTQGSLAITGSELKNNYANSAGGAIYSSSANLYLKNSKVYNNNAEDGGAVYKIGSIFDIINCLFYDNSAVTNGGAINLSSVTACNIYLSTFAFNISEFGGVIYGDICVIKFYNSIESANGAYDQGAFAYFVTGSLEIDYSCYNNSIQNGSVDYKPDAKTGDPKFVNPTGRDFNLRSDSQCVNTGSNDAKFLPVGITTDLAGNNRKVGTVDMGCYERQ